MPCGDADALGREERKNGDSILPFSLNVVASRITTCGPFSWDGGVEPLAVRRGDALVRLIDGGELLEDLAGCRIQLVGRVIRVAQRDDRVGLRRAYQGHEGIEGTLSRTPSRMLSIQTIANAGEGAHLARSPGRAPAARGLSRSCPIDDDVFAVACVVAPVPSFSPTWAWPITRARRLAIAAQNLATSCCAAGHRPIAYASTAGAGGRRGVAAKGIRGDRRPATTLFEASSTSLMLHHSIPCGEALIRFLSVAGHQPVCTRLRAPGSKLWLHFPRGGTPTCAVDAALPGSSGAAEGVDRRRGRGAAQRRRSDARAAASASARTEALEGRRVRGRPPRCPRFQAACESLGITLDVVGREDAAWP